MEHAAALVLVVVAFAGVQSVFGVGLLVFGTPCLLLLGLSFTEVLAYLLPASMVISLLQVLGGRRHLGGIRRDLLVFTGPTVLVTSALVVGGGLDLNIRPLVGGMLVLTAAIRLVTPLRDALTNFARRRLRWLLVGLGLVHGASNLGGGILTVIVSSVHADKQAIREQIAFGYLMMAGLQLSTLVLAGWPDVDMSVWVALPAIAAATYAVLGRRLFQATGQVAYQWVITLLVASFGALLLTPPM